MVFVEIISGEMIFDILVLANSTSDIMTQGTEPIPSEKLAM